MPTASWFCTFCSIHCTPPRYVTEETSAVRFPPFIYWSNIRALKQKTPCLSKMQEIACSNGTILSPDRTKCLCASGYYLDDTVPQNLTVLSDACKPCDASTFSVVAGTTSVTACTLVSPCTWFRFNCRIYVYDKHAHSSNWRCTFRWCCNSWSWCSHANVLL